MDVFALARVIAVSLALSSESVFALEKLRVLTWPGYADDDLVAQFEARENVDVEVTYIHSDDALWDKIDAHDGADVDVFAANTAELQRYIDAQRVVSLDLSKLPQRRLQLERFRALNKIPGLQRDGQSYAIPYTYAEMGLIYNRQRVPSPPTSMAALWDPQWQGQVLAFDGGTHNFTLAALVAGVSNPFQLSANERRAAVQSLVALRRNVLAFYTSPEEAVELFQENDVALVFANYGNQQVTALRQAGADIGYVIPQEGALAWLDCWAMTRGAKNPDLAHRWINFTLEPSMSTALVERQGLSNTVSVSAATHASDKLIWLEPVEDTDARGKLWAQIRSGARPETIYVP